MEDLITLIVFLVFVVGSLVNSVSQAKKKRMEELEKSLREDEGVSDLDGGAVRSEPVSLPDPEKKKRPAKPRSWEELRRQLEQVLTDSEVSPKTTPTAGSPPAQPPAEREPQPPGKPAVRKVPEPPAGRKPVSRKRPILSTIRQRARQRTGVPRKIPPEGRSRYAVSPSAAAHLEKRRAHKEAARPFEDSRTTESGSGTNVRKQRSFPDLHPNPVVNAILVSEVLAPNRKGASLVQRRWLVR